MAARGDEEEDLLAGVVEDRRDHGDIGQMRAAVIGGVEHEDIAGTHRVAARAGDGGDTLPHRAEMDGHVRGVGDELAVAIEERAGEIQPLLDVDRVSGVLQGHAHLLGDRHEQVVEDLEHHRVDFGADGRRALQRHDTAQDDMVARRHLGLPTGLDDGGRVLLGNDRGAGDAHARLELVTVVDRCRVDPARRRTSAHAPAVPAASCRPPAAQDRRRFRCGPRLQRPRPRR